MANRHRGEISAILDGETYTLCLTLGALAELEDAFGGKDMLAIAERFESGRLRAGDIIKVIGAGLRGAGAKITDDQMRHMRVEGGAAGYVAVAADLLAATFGLTPNEDGDAPPPPDA